MSATAFLSIKLMLHGVHIVCDLRFVALKLYPLIENNNIISTSSILATKASSLEEPIFFVFCFTAPSSMSAICETSALDTAVDEEFSGHGLFGSKTVLIRSSYLEVITICFCAFWKRILSIHFFKQLGQESGSPDKTGQSAEMVRGTGFEPWILPWNINHLQARTYKEKESVLPYGQSERQGQLK